MNFQTVIPSYKVLAKCELTCFKFTWLDAKSISERKFSGMIDPRIVKLLEYTKIFSFVGLGVVGSLFLGWAECGVRPNLWELGENVDLGRQFVNYSGLLVFIGLGKWALAKSVAHSPSFPTIGAIFIGDGSKWAISKCFGFKELTCHRFKYLNFEVRIWLRVHTWLDLGYVCTYMPFLFPKSHHLLFVFLAVLHSPFLVWSSTGFIVIVKL